MKRLSLLALFALLVTAPAVLAAPASPFTGPWRSIDSGDGSAQSLSIAGGAKVQMNYVDHYGSICVDNSAPTNVFEGSLTAVRSGNVLTATWKSAHCGRVRFDVSGWGPWVLTYDSGTNTLGDGVDTWSRP